MPIMSHANESYRPRRIVSAESKAGVVMQASDLLDTATADLVTNIWGFDKVPECTGRSVTLWT